MSISEKMHETEQQLKQIFGYAQFRKGQREIISHILQKEDVFGIMPTGAGKSICYQIPAIMFSGMTIVISPLISLMQDQLNALQANGIPAVCLNSMLDEEHYQEACRKIYRQEIKLLYVTPERLETAHFRRMMAEISVSMVTIDEAHCVSQWGHNFRQSYRNILPFVEQLPERPVISAFTATATEEVAEDVKNLLGLRQPFCLTTGFNRENLYFAVQQPRDKMQALLQFLQKNRNQSGIVYCLSRKLVEQVTENLQRAGFRAVRYHAGLSDKERKENQNAFLYDEVQIIVATNAFGMGIDKSDVKFVIHYNMPKNLENYYQEAGRAGRDGSPAECVIFYAASDLRLNRFLIENANENAEIDEEVRKKIQQKDKEKLFIIQKYCQVQGCLRKNLLQYFGEKTVEYCGNCSYCRTNCWQKEITIDAQKIISCVYRLQRMNLHFPQKKLIEILQGSEREEYQHLQLPEKLSTYGIMKETSETDCRKIIAYLVQTELLSEKEKILSINQKSVAFLKEKQKLFMPEIAVHSAPVTRKKSEIKEEKLFLLLAQCRKTIAEKEHLPAYIIFTDMTLRDMCRKKPVSDMAFLSVSGVGRVKLEKYGDAFMKIIRNYNYQQQNEN